MIQEADLGEWKTGHSNQLKVFVQGEVSPEK
jgi:hypothetical protein